LTIVYYALLNTEYATRNSIMNCFVCWELPRGSVYCTLYRCFVGVRAAFEPREASFDFAAGPVWVLYGTLGVRDWSPRVLDLLDLVGGIYRVESQIPPRPTNPAKE